MAAIDSSYSRHPCRFPECGKAFRKPYELRNHRRVHTNERPYRCGVLTCGRTFRWRSGLRYHRKNSVCTTARSPICKLRSATCTSAPLATPFDRHTAIPTQSQPRSPSTQKPALRYLGARSTPTLIDRNTLSSSKVLYSTKSDRAASSPRSLSQLASHPSTIDSKLPMRNRDGTTSIPPAQACQNLEMHSKFLNSSWNRSFEDTRRPNIAPVSSNDPFPSELLSPSHASETMSSSTVALDCGPSGFLVDLEEISPPADPLIEQY